jgi:hypothetical protein
MSIVQMPSGETSNASVPVDLFRIGRRANAIRHPLLRL